jgi:hypothetical protein
MLSLDFRFTLGDYKVIKCPVKVKCVSHRFSTTECAVMSVLLEGVIISLDRYYMWEFPT